MPKAMFTDHMINFFPLQMFTHNIHGAAHGDCQGDMLHSVVYPVRKFAIPVGGGQGFFSSSYCF